MPDFRSLITPLYAPGRGPDTLAAFGAEVVRLAEREDSDAMEILNGQMIQFAGLAAALLQAVPEAAARTGLSGGLFTNSTLSCFLFTRALQASCPEVKISLADRPPALGAVVLAMLRSGVTAEKIPAFVQNQ